MTNEEEKISKLIDGLNDLSKLSIQTSSKLITVTEQKIALQNALIEALLYVEGSNGFRGGLYGCQVPTEVLNQWIKLIKPNQ